MATKSLEQLLKPAYVTRVISKIKTPGSRLQTWFGCLPGGSNTKPVPARTTEWDIYNSTRGVAHMRAPGTGPGTVKKQIIGHVSATLGRAHDKTMLADEDLHRIRIIGQNYGNIEDRGQTYIQKQEKYLAQTFRNLREMLLMFMIRGSLMLKREGDDWIPVASGGHVTIDFKNPYLTTGSPNTLAQQKALSMTLVGNDVASTPFSGMGGTGYTSGAGDPISDYLGLNAGAVATQGRPIRHAWCDSSTIGLLFNNTVLKGAAGSANIIFDTFALRERGLIGGGDGTTGSGPNTDFEYVVVFKALPNLVFHVCDDGLDIYNGTNTVFTKLFPAGYIAYMPDVDSDWFEMHEGTELVRENVLAAPVERTGLAAWTEARTQPGGFELLALDNCLPALYQPQCIIFLNVA